jgi:hypothetical protein
MFLQGKIKSTFIFLLLFQFCFADETIILQRDSLKLIKAKKIGLGVFCGGLTAGSLVYLNQAWYSQYNSGKFHYFDDSNEWLQMDKAGHFLSTFQISNLTMKAFKWAGYNTKQKLFIGGTLGFGYMTAIEIMDGYSTGWGFSWADMTANTLGTALAISQEAAWKEQRFNLKISYHQTQYAQYNPELLGKNLNEQILKDYNGQTYWLSVSPFAFIKSDKKLPKWLAVSFGYGADGMIGAVYNNFVIQDDQGNVKAFKRERQYYFSIDVDLSKIKTKYKFVNAILNSLNIIKIPAPTLEFQHGRTKLYYLYF